MTTSSPIAVFVSLVLVLASWAVFPYQCYNPYLPYNAIAAQPDSPYNSYMVPKISRTAYPPCPSHGPVQLQFPDVPPIGTSIRGPFGVPVPVP